MAINFRDIIKHFQIKGEIVKVAAFGDGLINQTYRLHNSDSQAPDYLLQKVNHLVFKDIPGLTANLQLVTDHLRTRAAEQQEVLTPVPTLNSTIIYQKGDEFWRMFIFMKGLKSYNTAPDLQHVYEGASAFGNFIKAMSDFPTNKLHEVIPDFHRLDKRLQQLAQARQGAEKERLAKCARLLSEVDHQYQRLEELMKK